MPQFPIQLWFLWVVFLLEGMFTLVTLPLWEGFDEPFHFAVVRTLALEHRWPQPGETLPPAILDTFRRLPLPDALLAPGHRGHSDYWNSTGPPPNPPPQTWRMYESQQVPLYYLVLSLALVPASHLPIEHQVLLLRLVTLLLASALIPLAWCIAGPRHGIWTAAFIVFLPQYVMTSARIANDSFAAVCFALVAYTITRLPNWAGHWLAALVVGAVTGLALLAKSYLLILLPALWFSAGLAGLRGAIIATTAATAIAGPLYISTWFATGSLTGEQIEAGVHLSPSELFHLTTHVDWLGALSFGFNSHIWLGNWSFIGLRSWMYQLLALLFVIVATSAAFQLPRGPLVRFLLAAQLMLPVGLAWHVILNFAASGRSSTFGHYLDGCLLAESVILAPALTSISGRLMLAGFIVFNAFGRWIYLLPFYAGWIRKTPSGSLPAFPWQAYNSNSLARLSSQLAHNLHLPDYWLSLLIWIGLTITILKLTFVVNEKELPLIQKTADMQHVAEGSANKLTPGNKRKILK